jgi:hypothetical protein
MHFCNRFYWPLDRVLSVCPICEHLEPQFEKADDRVALLYFIVIGKLRPLAKAPVCMAISPHAPLQYYVLLYAIPCQCTFWFIGPFCLVHFVNRLCKLSVRFIGPFRPMHFFNWLLTRMHFWFIGPSLCIHFRHSVWALYASAT